MKEALRIFADELAAIEAAGTKKDERVITTPQSARIDTCLLYTSCPTNIPLLPYPHQSLLFSMI